MPGLEWKYLAENPLFSAMIVDRDHRQTLAFVG
jgi:hypothetical protein